MALSTNLALARRAVLTARNLEYWLKKLDDELQKQNINFEARYDKERTVTLKLALVQDMMLHMQDLIANVRQFKAPKGAD